MNCCEVSAGNTKIHNESRSIPLGISGRALFVFAHPDDDVFITGTMKKYILSGLGIRAVWLTSGGYFGGQKRREQELTRAASELGLLSQDYDLLRFPDLGLMNSMNNAALELSAILCDFKPDKIFVTAFEGGHPDHDAANFIVHDASIRSELKCDIFEFPLYNGAGSLLTWRWRINSFPPGGPSPLFQPLQETEINCKYKSMKIYSSQWMYMVPARLTRSRNFLTRHGEPYRLCPSDRDHCIPPHKGRLNYERWFNSFMRVKFTDFARAVKKARSLL
ncbi:MAG: PIG-L deacetylase family protein [Pseudomonadota bacterium]